MTSANWERIKQVLEDTLQLSLEKRPAFLDSACTGDIALRAEVESLVAAHEAAGSQFLDSPASGLLDITADMPASRIGQSVGPYRILQEIGRGGMGVVYKAEDMRLHRFVALKFLAEEISRNSISLARFRREAQAASALNHPHICTVHDIGQQGRAQYLVMELLEGETLASRLTKSALPPECVVQYGIEIADALDAAHHRGIVHRDLKPGNIFITTRGDCKVLDFGLAKLEEENTPEARTAVASHPEVLTSQGLAIGTVAYMSPEQARGEKLDARTDIFSLGSVLYEMATGQLAFPGKTSAVIFSAILNGTPKPPTQINPISPVQLDEVVRKALEKHPGLRYQSAADLRSDLQRLKHDRESGRISNASAGPRIRAGLARIGGARLVRSFLSALLLISVVAAGLYYRAHEAKPLSGKDTIVLADFANTTGDALFDDALRQALTSQLEQSPFLLLLSDDRIAQTLSLMSMPKNARLTHELARQVCQRSGSAAVLDGSIAQLGTQYLLGLKAINCSNGETLTDTTMQARDKDHVLEALGKLAADTRSKLGESLSSVQKFDVPPENVTTSSLEALKAYSSGYRTFMVDVNLPAAAPLFERAIELDPNFAMAHARLGNTLSQMGESSRAATSLRKAYALRERVSERERLYIVSHYEQVVLGNLEAERKTYELWRQTYPRDDVSEYLCVVYDLLGDAQKALAACRDSTKQNPALASAYTNEVGDLLSLNRLEEAKSTAEEGRGRNFDNPYVQLNLYWIAFLQQDAAAMDREAAKILGTSGYEHTIFYVESDTAAYAGKFGEARDLTGRAVEFARRTEQKETAANYQAAAALREALVGNVTLAKKEVEAADAVSHEPDTETASALVLGLAGDVALATRLANDLNKRFPDDTLVQFSALPMIHASIALSKHEAERSVQILETALPYERGDRNLYAAYLRGESHLDLKEGAAAAAEFQKLLDHTGIVKNDLHGALAHLGLGRACVLQGDTVKARAAYQDFLRLWKNADPDIPILKQAKAEYAKLQ